MKNFLKKLLDEGLGAFLKYAFGDNTGVYYINGSESLPPPLTREEEEAAFQLMETDFSAARGNPHRAQPAAGRVHREEVREYRRGT